MLIRKHTQRMSGESIADLIGQLHIKNVPALIRARGSSMAPFIQDGDLMTILPPKKTGLGDIVAFLKPESKEFIVHRIVGKSGTHFIAKGDNVFGPSDLISSSNIIGAVIETKRSFGKIQRMGFGPEKKIIGILSRLKILNIILFFWKNLLRYTTCILL